MKMALIFPFKWAVTESDVLQKETERKAKHVGFFFIFNKNYRNVGLGIDSEIVDE